MRSLAILLATLVLAGCSRNADTRSDAPAANPEVVEFLLSSAARDFHAHHPPDPVRFRNVRTGHSAIPGGEVQYMMCGEFLPAQTAGKAEWVAFTTIKTSGYEQYIGGQAAGFSHNSTVIWDRSDRDLSSELLSRLESLRGGQGGKS